MTEPQRKTVPLIEPAVSESLSLRDPSGQLFQIGGRLIRVLQNEAVADFKAGNSSSIVRRLVSEGQFVQTLFLPREDQMKWADYFSENKSLRFESIGQVVEHPKVFFRSYPYEWPAEMLHVAGELLLELSEGLLREGLGLKDATPYNILFEGSKAVYVDVLSIEKRVSKDPIWRPCGQFAKMFLNPLLVNHCFSIPVHQTLFSHPRGIEPTEIELMCGPLRRYLPPFLGMITLPSFLSRLSQRASLSIYELHKVENDPQARFLLRALFHRLRRNLERVKPKLKRQSFWSRYMTENLPYTEEDREAKMSFLENVVKRIRPESVLDVGCNTGQYSAVAAKLGAKVVAVDTDSISVGRTWRFARSENLNILPLVVDLISPSPASGWLNEERSSFISRAENRFDLVTFLAVIHHMTVGDGVPLSEVFRLAHRLTRQWALVELVDREDPKVRSLARGRDSSFLTQEAFDRESSVYFNCEEVRTLPGGHRHLYLLNKKHR